jgi:predicted RNA-binding Zn-ribbon protein involved in translation (DUF1610 family)
MGNEEKGLSTAESLRKTRTYGRVRCHNPSCMARLDPEPGASQAKCPKCGMEWRIAWVKKGFPRIRGPVWDVDTKLAEEALAKKMKEADKKSAEEAQARKTKEEKHDGPK